MSDRYTTPPDLADLEQMAQAAFETIPEELSRHTEDVVIRVQDFPDPETIEEMGLETPFDLLGLYSGVSIDRRSVTAMPTTIDMIFLYRRPLLDYWCATGEDLGDLVRHVLVHEIGHHFGFSDDDMERIEGDAS